MDNNNIIKEEELLNLKIEINLVKAHLKVPQNIAVLDLSPFEFLNFCKSNDISTVFLRV